MAIINRHKLPSTQKFATYRNYATIEDKNKTRKHRELELADSLRDPGLSQGSGGGRTCIKNIIMPGIQKCSVAFCFAFVGCIYVYLLTVIRNAAVEFWEQK